MVESLITVLRLDLDIMVVSRDPNMDPQNTIIFVTGSHRGAPNFGESSIYLRPYLSRVVRLAFFHVLGSTEYAVEKSL